MALDNYADLKSAVESWIDREGDTEVIDRIPDFIVFGEKKTFRHLRSRLNEEYKEYASGNNEGITLPQDFKEVKYLLWNGRVLERKSDQWYLQNDPVNSASGDPVYFARTRVDLIEFWPPPDDDAQVELFYYNAQAAISDSFIPPLYTEAPELYLFGALREALPFLKDKSSGPLWDAKYDDVMTDLQDEADEAEYAGGTVQVSNAYSDSELRDVSTRIY